MSKRSQHVAETHDFTASFAGMLIAIALIGEFRTTLEKLQNEWVGLATHDESQDERGRPRLREELSRIKSRESS